MYEQEIERGKLILAWKADHKNCDTHIFLQNGGNQDAILVGGSPPSSPLLRIVLRNEHREGVLDVTGMSL